MSIHRRNSLELYRDALLILAMEGKPLKRTPFMYSLNISYNTFNALIDDMLEKGLIEKVTPREALRREGARQNARVDKRTRYLVEITGKGQFVVRLLDEMLKYILDTSPNVRPPLRLLKELYRGTQIKSLPRLELFIFNDELDLPAKFVVSHYKILNNGFRDLPAGFEIRKTGLFCPECGRNIPSLRGLKIHIGKMHREKKKEIWRKVELFLKTIPILSEVAAEKL